MIHRRFSTFFRLDASKRRELVEAALLFHAARTALRVVPFRRLSALLGSTESPPDDRYQPSGDEVDTAHAVRRAMRWAARNHPETCLARALAGRVMLRRRGLGSAMYFGVKKDEDQTMKFHAWLRHGEVFVTGREGHRSYTVLSTFYDPRTAAVASVA